MKTFAVAGIARSGTTSLAEALALDPAWEVLHEPEKRFCSAAKHQERFDAPRVGGLNYGEVNFRLLNQLSALRVDQKAILLRNPEDIFKSFWKRDFPHFPRNQPGYLIRFLNDSLATIDAAIVAGVRVIAFSRLVSEPKYLHRIAEELGVGLPPYTQLPWLNISRRSTEVPAKQVQYAAQKMAWFLRLHKDKW